MRRRRPFGVTVIAILQALSGPATGFAVLLNRAELRLELGDFRLDIAVAGLITAAGLVIAFGLWRLFRWAWVCAMLWTGASLAVALYVYFQGRADYLLMIEGIVIVFYLNQRDVRRAFEGPATVNG
jgi:uncharacterized membrane protein (DUF2068 family)